ncbi:TorF family putative porin [uncultured Sphingomonas sp.]|uniref:TorF family putative porin n=1 Tax=uncultured Sphingomonas sp. TaxID=158754 RepID=UPI0035CC1F5D
MRFFHISLGVIAVAIAAPAMAQEETAPTPTFTFTGNVTAISDYRFRGLTQTNEDPAVQATVNINHKSGLYAGVWTSTIDGGRDGSTPALTGYGGAEVDLYGGFTRTLKGGLGFDVGLLYYYYPGGVKTLNTDFFEPYASVNYTIGPVNAKVGAAYAWGGQSGLDFTSGSDDNIYAYGELAAGIPTTPLTLKGHLGYTKGSLGLVNFVGSDDSYFDWSATAEAAIGHVKVGVSYIDTDISSATGTFTKGSRTGSVRRFDRFDQFYGRGSTVLGYVGLTF